MASYGFSAEAIAEMRAALGAKIEDDRYLVHPVNVTAVRLFQAVRTQWRTASLSTMGGARVVFTGLDYTALDVTARILGLQLDADELARISWMEVTALNAWAAEARR